MLHFVTTTDSFPGVPMLRVVIDHPATVLYSSKKNVASIPVIKEMAIDCRLRKDPCLSFHQLTKTEEHVVLLNRFLDEVRAHILDCLV